jgi:Cu(I)/Ag(I) efflux system membrane fusion protein
MRGQYSILVLLLSVVLLITGYLVSCKENEIKEAEFPSTNTNIITLTQESLELINPRIEKVPLRSMPIGFTSSGRVGFNEKKLVHITSKVSGWVEKVYSFIGDRVLKGDTLVTIYSPEYLSAQSEFIQAEERLKSVSRTDSVEYKTAFALFNSAKAKLLLLGASETEAKDLSDNHQPKSPLAIRSPLSGTVIESSVITGSVVSKEDNLFEVSDLSSLWIMANVYERDITLVKKGQVVEITISAIPEKTFSGTVEAINDVLDETTRTFKVRIGVDNTGGLLKPKMFCQCQFKAQFSEKLLAVPLSAVQTMEGEKYVFLPKGEGSFEKRAIKTGRELGNYLEVLEGLEPGEEVVTEGSFTLKSELLKAEFGEE